MKCRFATLLIVPSLFISQVAWGADTKGMESAADRVVALPFNKAAPLPGALAVSADGHLAAHISAGGDIVIWDTSQLKPIELIPSSGKQPSAVSLSPDGNLIAIGYFDSRLVVWSRQERKPLREFFGHAGGISALSFSSDGQLLASGGDDATTQLWEVATGKRLRVFDSMSNDDISTGSGIPVSIGFSGDDKALIVNEWYSRFYDVGRGTTIWDIGEGIEISTRAVAPPNGDNAMRAGQAVGGKGWLLAYTGGWLQDETGLMVERLDQCDPPRQTAVWWLCRYRRRRFARPLGCRNGGRKDHFFRAEPRQENPSLGASGEDHCFSVASRRPFRVCAHDCGHQA